MSKHARNPMTMTRRRLVAEDTAVLDRPTARRVAIVETPTIVKTAGTKPSRLLIQLIKAGWSGNGRYYSEAVLKRDGPTTFPSGTLNFVDHATDEETMERPSGTLTRLASVQTAPAYYDTARKALMAEVRVFEPWREAVLDWAESGAIGMSIRAFAEGEDGKAEGKDGWIVSALTEGRSVDYVTKPAAGGAIVTVLEAMGHPQNIEEARNIGAWLESRLHLALTQLGDDMYGNGRLSREERIVLSSAMGDALKAWTTRVEADAPVLFTRDLYDEPGATERATSEVQETAPGDPPAAGTSNEPASSLEVPPEPPTNVDPPAPDPPAEAAEPTPETPPPTDPPAEQAAPDSTEQVPPGTDPAGPASTEESNMSDPPGQQTTTPGTARQVIEAEVAEMRREMAMMRAREAARVVLKQALADDWIPPAAVANITESLMDRLPLLASGQLDESELTKMAGRELARREQEIAEAATAAGWGRVRDLGSGGGSYGSGPAGLGVAEVEGRLEKAFLALDNNEKVAKIAAKGRDW